MAYAWVVDREHLLGDGIEASGEGRSRVGVTGPRGAPDDLLARLRAGEGEKWRCKDEDDELYYSGRIVFTGGECEGEEDFGPLWDFATPDAGATDIQYIVNGKWASL